MSLHPIVLLCFCSLKLDSFPNSLSKEDSTVQYSAVGGSGGVIGWVLTGERVDAGREAVVHTGSYPPRNFHLAAAARLLLCLTLFPSV